MDTLLTHSWFVWGLVLVIGLPVLMLLLDEVIFRLDKWGSPFISTLRSLRNLVIPSLSILLLTEQVIGYAETSTPVRIVETVFWVCVINAAILGVNALLFVDSAVDSWRSQVPKLFLDLSRIFLVLVGTAFVLSAIWDAPLGRLFAALGVGSVVIGLALQDTLGGLFSGIALLSSRNFRVGEWLQVGETDGQVTEVTWRAVSVRTRDNDLLVVPNSALAKESIHNYSRPSPRREHSAILTLLAAAFDVGQRPARRCRYTWHTAGPTSDYWCTHTTKPPSA